MVWVSYAVRGELPVVDRVRNVLQFAVDEEEELILDDRSPQRHSIDVASVAWAVAEVFAIRLVAAEVLALDISVGRPFECVATALSHSIDTGREEVAVLHVKRRSDNLHFLDSVDRNRTVLGRHAHTLKPHVVVEV